MLSSTRPRAITEVAVEEMISGLSGSGRRLLHSSSISSVADLGWVMRNSFDQLNVCNRRSDPRMTQKHRQMSSSRRRFRSGARQVGVRKIDGRIASTRSR
jgi:hypothetical protein